MKALYYLEFAVSVDHDNNIIPAKKMRWVTPDNVKIAYEDPFLATQERYSHQESLHKHVVRIRQAGFFKNIVIRLSDRSGGEWIVVKS